MTTDDEGASGSSRVPFRNLTKDEEKQFSRHYESVKKQVDHAFEKKG